MKLKDINGYYDFLHGYLIHVDGLRDKEPKIFKLLNYSHFLEVTFKEFEKYGNKIVKHLIIKNVGVLDFFIGDFDSETEIESIKAFDKNESLLRWIDSDGILHENLNNKLTFRRKS